jgi:hypothetical protein
MVRSNLNEEVLKSHYEKQANKFMYRVVSEEYIKDILKKGLVPKKNPYKNKIRKIKKLYALLLKLGENGFIHTQKWGTQITKIEKIVRVGLEDLNKRYIDFTPHIKDIEYYKKLKGGAIVNSIKKITSDIIRKKPNLTAKELALVEHLHSWALFKSKFKAKTIFVKSTSKYFESAKFQVLSPGSNERRYIKSPFGRFKHFKKIINKFGLELYLPFFKGKLFHLRLTKKMPAKEIDRIE